MGKVVCSGDGLRKCRSHFYGYVGYASRTLAQKLLRFLPALHTPKLYTYQGLVDLITKQCISPSPQSLKAKVDNETGHPTTRSTTPYILTAQP